MKSKISLYIILFLIVIIFVFGISYAILSYQKLSGDNKITTGEINLILKESENGINLKNAFPESAIKAREKKDNEFIFTISSKNTTLNKKIYYEIKLNEGEEISDKTRFKSSDLVFDLYEIDGENETLIVDSESFSDFNEKVIWIDNINSNTAETRTYKLKMWLSDNVIISNTDLNASYTVSEFENSYASVKISVYGDFLEKKLPISLENIIENKLTLSEEDVDGTRYVIGSNPNNYVWYSGKLWRIVSIDRKGHIKLVTDGNITTLSWDTISGNTDYSNSQIRKWLNEEFLETINKDLIIDTTWDYTSVPVFPTKKPETDISKTIIDKVGTISIYDYMMTGGTTSSSTSDTYLINGYYGWFITPKTDGEIWTIMRNKYASAYGTIARMFGVRPAVNLQSKIRIISDETMDGTKENPYRLEGDTKVGLNGENINTRISGEYLNFNNTLYRIVGIDTINNKKFTKVVMADYDKNLNSIATAVQFGSNETEITFNKAYGIGAYLDNWYNATSESEIYSNNYITEEFKQMIATDLDDVVWYPGPDLGISETSSYTLAKTGNPVSATIGLLRYGEMFASQFGSGSSLSEDVWTLSKYSGNKIFNVRYSGRIESVDPITTSGVRPSFYLKENVKIKNGLGTLSNPYNIYM